MNVTAEDMEYVRAIAKAHGSTNEEALHRLLKAGFSRVNALLNHAQGGADPKRPAPGRKAGGARAKKAKAKKAAAE